EATYSSNRAMPNTIAPASCQPSPRTAARVMSTAPPASAAAAPTPWVSALASSSRRCCSRGSGRASLSTPACCIAAAYQPVSCAGGSGVRVAQHHGVLAVRTGADNTDRAAGQFLQRAQVGARRRRQPVPFGDAVGVLAPARELQVHRRALVPALRVQRRVLAALAAVFVGDADLQLLHAVEHVELGDAQAADAVDRHRALERDDVHPAAAARAAGRGAVFGAAVADALADLVVQL